ncbi:hypothetical protein LINPERPRIM_LOCUS31308 [Linum perenne]
MILVYGMETMQVGAGAFCAFLEIADETFTQIRMNENADESLNQSLPGKFYVIVCCRLIKVKKMKFKSHYSSCKHISLFIYHSGLGRG